MVTLSAQKSILFTAAFTFLCSSPGCGYGYSFGLKIPGWNHNKNNNSDLISVNGQKEEAALSPTPDPCIELFREEDSILAADRISNQDREQVDPLIAKVVDHLSNGTETASCVREEAIAFYCQFFYSKFSTFGPSSHSDMKCCMPNCGSLNVSATWHRRDNQSQQAAAEEHHREVSGGENSDTGLQSVQLSDGGTVLLSGSAIPGKWNVMSYLHSYLGYLFSWRVPFLSSGYNHDGKTLILPLSEIGIDVPRKDIGDEDREQVDFIITKLADCLSNNTKAAASAREKTFAFGHDFFYGNYRTSRKVNYNLSMPNNDRLRLSATWHRRDWEELEKENKDKEFNRTQAEKSHHRWSGGENSDTGLLSVQLSDGGTVLLSGSVVPRSIWETLSKWLRPIAVFSLAAAIASQLILR